MAESRPAQVLGIFYGYPAEQIARWCGVSVKTARDYKARRRKPSRQSLRLFALHRDGRVLGDLWRGWCIRDGRIVDPEGNTTTVAQMRAYYILLQYTAELAKRDPETQRQYFELLKMGA